MISLLKTVFFSLVEDALRGLSGPLGLRMRRAYYSRRFRQCGQGLVIEPGVHIVRPEWISLGAHVWIDRFVTLIAGPPRTPERVQTRGSVSEAREGLINIGDHAHLGIGTIIQGHGGVSIGRGFTSSPHVKIYSLSNDYRRCRDGTVDKPSMPAFFIKSPVLIGENVWLGLDSIVIGHKIGSNTFVQPNAVISKDVDANSVAAGFPAIAVRSRFVNTATAP